jgi:hypothetical protein
MMNANIDNEEDRHQQAVAVVVAVAVAAPAGVDVDVDAAAAAPTGVDAVASSTTTTTTTTSTISASASASTSTRRRRTFKYNDVDAAVAPATSFLDLDDPILVTIFNYLGETQDELMTLTLVSKQVNKACKPVLEEFKRICRLELITILQQREEFPFGLKNKTDQLVVIFLHAMNANIDNEEDRHHQQAADANANDDDDIDGGRRRRRLELMTVLQQTEEFPFRYENKIDQLVQIFLHDFKDDKYEMLCDNYMLPPYDAIYMLPLYDALEYKSFNIQGFQMVVEAGIKYFSKKKGITLLFRKPNYDSTPFVKACEKFGKEQVKMMIEDTCIRCYSSSDDTPVVEALMTAAVDENIHLDCVYFLLRRQPDILQKILSSTSITTMAAAAADMVVFNSNDNGISPKKRKRKDTNIGDDGSTF